MQIKGYKCFHANLINRYGQHFELGRLYKADGLIRFGNNGNGFHFCQNMEDTLRYFNAMQENVSICKVLGSGLIDEYYDDYYGYYNMFAAECLEIIKELTREEIIDYALNLSIIRAMRFLSLYKLTEEEKILFREKFQQELLVQDIISYYQDNDLDVFTKRKEKHIWIK